MLENVPGAYTGKFLSWTGVRTHRISADQYRIVSNRESGQGRYDIAMYPLERNKDAFIMEFKVFDAKKERSLEQTAANALKQIEEKNYEADLIAAGIGRGQIYKRYCSEVNL